MLFLDTLLTLFGLLLLVPIAYLGALTLIFSRAKENKGEWVRSAREAEQKRVDKP